MKNDEIVYGGTSFTASAVARQSEEQFLTQHSFLWRHMSQAEREEELLRVMQKCKDLVNGVTEVPVLLKEEEPPVDPPAKETDSGKRSKKD